MALHDRNALSSAYGSCITSLSSYTARYTIKEKAIKCQVPASYDQRLSNISQFSSMNRSRYQESKTSNQPAMFVISILSQSSP